MFIPREWFTVFRNQYVHDLEAITLGVVVYVGNATLMGVEARGSEAKNQPWLHRKSEA